ncbi:Acetyltransferase (GNAT) family protein [Rhodospirillales bacterium URHD0017]|nr:Acetyltransferase (GNAT) family protein [Rhodospirillales bacterium URHD0017]
MACLRYLAWMSISIAREEDPAASRRLLEALTARLPEWFAQPDANRHYAEQAEVLESWSARLDGRAHGLLLLKKHSAVGAEIYWLAVDPAHHRQGIGRALIAAIEGRLKQDRLKYLFVTTLHPDDPYEPYRRTRAFYERLGFELVLSRQPLAYYLKLL